MGCSPLPQGGHPGHRVCSGRDHDGEACGGQSGLSSDAPGSEASRSSHGWDGMVHARMGGSACRTEFHEHHNVVDIHNHGLRNDGLHIHGTNNHQNHAGRSVSSGHRNGHRDRRHVPSDNHDHNRNHRGRIPIPDPHGIHGPNRPHGIHGPNRHHGDIRGPSPPHDGRSSRTLACDHRHGLQCIDSHSVHHLGRNQSVRTCKTLMAHHEGRFSPCQSQWRIYP